MSVPLIIGFSTMLTSEELSAAVEAGVELAAAASFAIAVGVCMCISIGFGMGHLKKYI